MLRSLWKLPSHPRTLLLWAARSSTIIAVSAGGMVCVLSPSLPSLQFLPNEKRNRCYCLHLWEEGQPSTRCCLKPCRWLPGAPSTWACVSGCLSSCPFQTGAGSDGVRWWHTLLQHPCATNPVSAALFSRGPQILRGKEVGTGTPGPWGPQACVTSRGWWGSQLGTVGAGQQTQYTLPVSCRVLKGSSYSSFWSLPPLDESQKQWRRDESFCIPKAIP